MQIEYIESYLREADEMIAKFEELCGKTARRYIVDIFVKHTKIEDIAQKNGVSKSQRLKNVFFLFLLFCMMVHHLHLNVNHPDLRSNES